MSYTPKQQAFIEAKAGGAGHAEAAMMAGYAAASAAVTGTRLMARKDVVEAIKKLQGAGGNGGAARISSDDPDPWALKDRYSDPLSLMLDVMNNPLAPKSLRYQAAKDAMPYCHARKEGGKKDEQKERAKKAAGGRFGTQGRPSHLRAVG